MLQDLTRGRSLEVEVLACSIAKMRRLLGLTKPTIDVVVELARLRGIPDVRSERQLRHCRQIDATAGPTLGIAVQQSSGLS